MSNDKKKKLQTQRHVSSRMNFLFQASNLMAAGNQTKLAAHYGKLCRNVGTKALMRMAPAVKRSLCRLCFLPLIPGVNTELQVAGAPNKVPPLQDPLNTAKKNGKKRHRRLRKKPNKKLKTEDAINSSESQPETLERIRLFLECSLCRSRQSFPTDNKKDCWLEQPQSVVSLPEENREIG
ncbi:ribonuclease P protein subunit p21 [Drosophila eugracilis]|uniref:ribonuclease P protein subunit p21 n=1 Tax=Drosophila eugracilis TaxID=29029 RepID=UPI0007E8908E|nr:ribonuclease P protein subunit p21 [Drosophila eugracilis]